MMLPRAAQSHDVGPGTVKEHVITGKVGILWVPHKLEEDGGPGSAWLKQREGKRQHGPSPMVQRKLLQRPHLKQVCRLSIAAVELWWPCCLAPRLARSLSEEARTVWRLPFRSQRKGEALEVTEAEAHSRIHAPL